jgi:hypothetical protein
MKALPTEMPESDLTLTAQWAANVYWVCFVENKPAGTSASNWVKVAYDALITKPTDPTVDHYTFVGWFEDAALTKEFDFTTTTLKDIKDFTPTTPATGDTWTTGQSFWNIRGKWTGEQYTVTFDTKTSVTIDPVTATYPYGIDMPTAITGTWKRDGYKDFITSGQNAGSWIYKDANGAGGTFTFGKTTGTTVPSNITVSPNWQPEKMTLTWANGTTVLVTTPNANVGSTLTPPEKDSKGNVIANLKRDGYRLDPENLWSNLPADGKVPYDPSLTYIFQLNWIEQIPVNFLYDNEVIATIAVDYNTALAGNDKIPTPAEAGKVYTWSLKG